MTGKPLRVKVTGNLDDPRTINVCNADTGEQISNLLEIAIQASGNGDCNITLTLFRGVELNVEGTAEVDLVSS